MQRLARFLYDMEVQSSDGKYPMRVKRFALGGLLFAPGFAFAHNCGNLSDCWQIPTAAALGGLGISVLVFFLPELLRLGLHLTKSLNIDPQTQNSETQTPLTEPSTMAATPEGIAAASELSALVSKGLLIEDLISNLRSVKKAIELAQDAGEIEDLISIANAMGLDGYSIAYLSDRILTDASVLALEKLVDLVIDEYYPTNAAVPPSIAKLWLHLAIDWLQGDYKGIFIDPLLLIAEEMTRLEADTTALEQGFIKGAVEHIEFLDSGSDRYDIVRTYAELADETVRELREGWWDWPSEKDAANKIAIIRDLLLYRADEMVPDEFESQSPRQIGEEILSYETPSMEIIGGLIVNSKDTKYRDFAKSVATLLGISYENRQQMGLEPTIA